MKRRDFLIKTGQAALGITLGSTLFQNPIGPLTTKAASPLEGLLIIDPHAHPDMNAPYWQDNSSSYRYMKEIGMAASCYSAIGDSGWRSKTNRSNFDIAVSYIDYWKNTIFKNRYVKPVLTFSDLPSPGTSVPGAILALEGGDALEGRIDRLIEFFNRGVRIITLVHYHNNELGDIMMARSGWDPGTYRGGLSSFGSKVIDKMQDLRMVIDVAHTSHKTLKDITSYCQSPLIDSHTTLCTSENKCGRARSKTEMEWIAKTGGVVCSCPAAWHGKQGKSFQDWAKELWEMKSLIGIEHIGIGTDGGGGLPLITGYHDVRDLPKLMGAMVDVGFSRDEIKAFMGGNAHRVLSKCLSA